MRLVSRQDRLLVAGFVLAVIVVFSRPLGALLDLAREVERQTGLALVPALLILVVVFVFHLQGKRQEADVQTAAAKAEAAAAGSRAAEMERLVLFGQALGRALDLDSIRAAVLQHLSTLAASDRAWALVLVQGAWHSLQPAVSTEDIDPARLRLAERVLGDTSGRRDPAVVEGQTCWPIRAGAVAFGVLGLPDDAAPAGLAGRKLEAAATLLAISLRNAGLFAEIRETSVRDGLTGCYNRTHTVEVLESELRRARRSQLPVSLVMFDLDHFKQINDRRGHLCGDAVLRAVGKRMREVLRTSDVKCRYGGEEFLAVLPETPVEGAKRVADTLRREIAGMSITWEEERLRVTASFGVTVALPSEVDAEAVIGRADAALYAAKSQGRNCVRLSLDPLVA